ncbi:hypothetical protein [Pseudofrankia asymbiotica]|uniref:Uncharacterized protein n=1 Tax=Pseudofrankia asymbiotica TaxID=1834516 RepID=A0A1V2HZB9_9ACTN|nr:hypothetical protein [Pseudofrankia asymbiotica]ONH22030.1 hypothetical protein BL253_36970 [Pseudofrankia asymbiotica]
MALRVDRIDYQPDSYLDTALADLCYQAIHDRTDQRPGTRGGSAVIRAVLPSHRQPCLAALENAGLEGVDEFTLYAPPPAINRDEPSARPRPAAAS